MIYENVFAHIELDCREKQAKESADWCKPLKACEHSICAIPISIVCHIGHSCSFSSLSLYTFVFCHLCDARTCLFTILLLGQVLKRVIFLIYISSLWFCLLLILMQYYVSIQFSLAYDASVHGHHVFVFVFVCCH